MKRPAVPTAVIAFLVFVSPSLTAVETLNPAWIAVDVGQATKPSFDFDSQDRIHVMGMTEAFPGFVWHAVADNALAEWNFTTLANGYFYGPGDLVVDPDDRAHVAFHDHDRQSPRHIIVSGSQIDADNTIPTTTQHDGWDNSLALDSQGNLHMTSVDPVDFGATNSLQHGIFTNSWSFENGIPGSGSFMYGFNTTVAVDSAGDIHILFCQSPDWLVPGDLKYAVKRSGTWIFSTVIGNGIRGRFPSIAVDDNDNLHAAWLDINSSNTSQATVQYGFLPQGSNAWQISPIDTLNSVALGFSNARKSTSIVIGANGNPRVAYGDKRIIRYGSQTEGEWSLETIAESTVDLYKGLVVLRLDSQDIPGIVFWNPAPGTLGAVRFARPTVTSTFDMKITMDFVDGETVLRWEGPAGETFSVETTSNLSDWSIGQGQLNANSTSYEYREATNSTGKVCYRVLQGSSGQ